MIRPSHLPGYESLHFLRTEWLRTGVYTGICCSFVLIAWLVVANRMPGVEQFAMEQKIAAAAPVTLLMLIPALRFRPKPLPIRFVAICDCLLMSVAIAPLDKYLN